MRNRASNVIDGIVSGMNRNIKSMVDRSIGTQQDRKDKDPSFYRDDLWRFGAFQLSNFLDVNDFATFGRGTGTRVGR